MELSYVTQKTGTDINYTTTTTTWMITTSSGSIELYMKQQDCFIEILTQQTETYSAYSKNFFEKSETCQRAKQLINNITD